MRFMKAFLTALGLLVVMIAQGGKAGADDICGPGMFYDPAHQICAPFAVPPPTSGPVLYCNGQFCWPVGGGV